MVMERMTAHWDSLAEHGDQAPQIARDYEPPLFRFSEEEQEKIVCSLYGKEVTLRDYYDGLREVPMALWPGGNSLEIVETQFNARVLIGLQLDAAKKRKLDQTQAYRDTEKMNREKFQLEQLTREVVNDLADPSEEEIVGFYEEHRKEYVRGNKIRFSYAVFRRKVEADGFYEMAKDATGEWWSGRLGGYQQRRPDIFLVPNSPTYDLTEPIPDSVQVLVELGDDKNVTDVLPPARYSSGGWVVGRVLYRERPGILSLERTRNGITRILQGRKTNAVIDSIVALGRERYGVQSFPENLGVEP